MLMQLMIDGQQLFDHDYVHVGIIAIAIAIALVDPLQVQFSLLNYIQISLSNLIFIRNFIVAAYTSFHFYDISFIFCCFCMHVILFIIFVWIQCN